MISRFHISTTRPRQSLERMERSVRRTSSVTMPTASSSIAAGSTKAAQIRLARGRPESLSRPCVRLRLPVWRRLTKRRLLAARSNGRTNKAAPCPKRPAGSENTFLRAGYSSAVTALQAKHLSEGRVYADLRQTSAAQGEAEGGWQITPVERVEK